MGEKIAVFKATLRLNLIQVQKYFKGDVIGLFQPTYGRIFVVDKWDVLEKLRQQKILSKSAKKTKYCSNFSRQNCRFYKGGHPPCNLKQTLTEYLKTMGRESRGNFDSSKVSSTDGSMVGEL